MKCPHCGKFVKDAEATVLFDEAITKVEATCSKCGTVEPTDWEYDDFFPEENP